jgi:hypothetical protein
MKDLSHVGESGVSLLTGHLTLYNRVRSEFYSPISPSLFLERDCIPQSIVILIDDIFDMYRRVSSEGEVFSEPIGFERLADRAQAALDYISEQHEFDRRELNNDELSLVRLEHRVDSLLRLLAWRRAETIQAELLARQLGCPFISVGVKHCKDLFRPLFVERRPQSTVYISHPITRPRQQRRVDGVWPSVVAQCNDLPSALAEDAFLPLMPTAIDELRFLPIATPDLLDRAPLLDHRWPVQSSLRDTFVAERGSFDGLDEGFLVEGCESADTHGFKLAQAAITRQLENAIYNEIPFRDHLLVAWSDILFVYRPLYEKGAFSRGVEAEINHWSQIAESETGRRAVFLHARSDVRLAARLLQQSPQLHRRVSRSLEHALRGVFSERENQIPSDKQIEMLLEGAVPTSELDDWKVSKGRIEQLTDEAFSRAGLSVLHNELTLLDAVTERAGAFIVLGADEGASCLPTEDLEPVLGFMRRETSAPSLESIFVDLFPEGPANWTRSVLGIDAKS